jgi:hypothetical protein
VTRETRFTYTLTYTILIITKGHSDTASFWTLTCKRGNEDISNTYLLMYEAEPFLRSAHCAAIQKIPSNFKEPEGSSPCSQEPSLPRLLVNFHNKIIFYGELLAPRPTPKLEDHPLSAVSDCLFNIFAATLHIWRPFPPFAT